MLEEAGRALGVPRGAVGVERLRVTFTGQAAHAGTTPLPLRRDAGAAAARLALAAREAARAAGGLATAGALRLEPGIVTAVAGRAELLVDLRHEHQERPPRPPRGRRTRRCGDRRRRARRGGGRAAVGDARGAVRQRGSSPRWTRRRPPAATLPAPRLRCPPRLRGGPADGRARARCCSCAASAGSATTASRTAPRTTSSPPSTPTPARSAAIRAASRGGAHRDARADATPRSAQLGADAPGDPLPRAGRKAIVPARTCRTSPSGSSQLAGAVEHDEAAVRIVLLRERSCRPPAASSRR